VILDWIVMRCLDKAAARRYPTASALAVDIECYLNDELVRLARRATHIGYRKSSAATERASLSVQRCSFPFSLV